MGFIDNSWEWIQGIFSLVATKLIVAVIVLLVGIIIGKILERLTHNGLHALELDRTLQKAGTRLFLEEIVSQLVKYLVYFIAVILMLETIGLTAFVLNIVAGIVIVVLLAGIILSIQDFAPNALAGLTLMRRGTVRKGSIIEYKDIVGTVIHAGLLELQLRTQKDDIYVVPNSVFLRDGFALRKTIPQSQALR